MYYNVNIKNGGINNMLVSELKQKLEDNLTFTDLWIEIKHYLPFIEKKILIENIVDGSIEYDENGLAKCNLFIKELNEKIGIIVNYTNIEIDSENTVRDFDVMCELGIIDYVLNNMNKNEKYFIEDMICEGIDQKVRLENSVEGILSKGINKIVEKLPNEKSIKKILNDIPKSVNKIKPENLEILKDTFKKQGDSNIN